MHRRRGGQQVGAGGGGCTGGDRGCEGGGEERRQWRRRRWSQEAARWWRAGGADGGVTVQPRERARVAVQPADARRLRALRAPPRQGKDAERHRRRRGRGGASQLGRTEHRPPATARNPPPRRRRRPRPTSQARIISRTINATQRIPSYLGVHILAAGDVNSCRIFAVAFSTVGRW